jgi:D-alanyl-D-alanine carboxypeptidase (penicillin-binding protein 5/6)
MLCRVFIKRIAALALCFVMCLVFASCGQDGGASSGSGVSYVRSSGMDSSASGSGAQPSGDGVEAAPPKGLYEPEYAVQATAAYLINEESGAVVYAKNADAPLVAASLVKMMTCIITMDMVQDLDGETVTAETWVFNELYGKNASTADIWKGETCTVRELLYAMLLPSANEAALMLAGYISGGYLPNFLYLMNQKAQALGCTGTVFADPNGLSEQNLTTARDMALIMRAFMQYPVLVEIASTSRYEMAAHNHGAPYNILTTDRFMVDADSYTQEYGMAGVVLAGKTGGLGEWQNFVSCAERNGERYICAVLGSPNSADPVAPELGSTQYRPALCETAEIYNWAYKNYAVQPALDTGKPIAEVRVKYSTAQDSVLLLPAENMLTVLPKDGMENFEMEFDLPEYVSAPVEGGQVVGTVTLRLRGQTLGTINLVASQSVRRNTFKYILQKIGEFFGLTIVYVVLVLLILAAIGYGVMVAMAGARHRKRRHRRPNNNRRSNNYRPPPRHER